MSADMAKPYRLSSCGELSGEKIDKLGDIVASVGKPRHFKGNNIEPVVEVFAKTPLFDHLRKVTVRGSHHPYIDIDCAARANRLDLPLFEHA